MKLKELSQRLNRAESTVCRWLNGTRRISAEDARELERETGIDRRAWIWPDEYPNPMMRKPSPPSGRDLSDGA